MDKEEYSEEEQEIQAEKKLITDLIYIVTDFKLGLNDPEEDDGSMLIYSVKNTIRESAIDARLRARLLKKSKHVLDEFNNLITDEFISFIKKEMKKKGVKKKKYKKYLSVPIISTNFLYSLAPVTSYTEEQKDDMSMIYKNKKEAEKGADEKIIGQRVIIPHALFTNMLVTEEGVQVQCSSFTIPAIPELVDKTAIVIDIKCDKPYVCGACSKFHAADTKIVYPDGVIYYIYHAFLKPLAKDEYQE